MRVACYERIGRGSARPIELRLVPYGGDGSPIYLDPPAPAEAWNASMANRVHVGIFRVYSSSGVDFTLCAADDSHRLLQRRDASVSAGWTGAFPAAMLTAATVRDAPKSIQGFAVRNTIVLALLLSYSAFPFPGPPAPPHRRRAAA